MKRMLASAALVGVVLALAGSAGGVLASGYSVAQEAVTIGVDVDPTGNTATSLGPVDSCVAVSSGETFQVDLFITDVRDLLAWEAYFTYDMAIVDIVDRDVAMFQAANADSNVFDVSEGLPDIDGLYRVAAADISEPPAVDSGSGVLARLTLKAVGAGVSPAALSLIDVNNDGTVDLGPFLKDNQGNYVGDVNGDSFFDGPISNAQIAVDTVCPSGTPLVSPTAPASTTPTPPVASPTTAASPTAEATPRLTATVVPTPVASPTASPSDEPPETTSDDDFPWLIVYIGGSIAAVAIVAVGSVVGLRMRRRAG